MPDNSFLEGAQIGDALVGSSVRSLQTHQKAKAEKEQAQWNRQLQMAEMGMKLAENKNLPADQRVKAFNEGVRPVLSRLGMNMPELSAQTLGTYQDAIKNTRKLTEQAQKGDISWNTAFTGATTHFTDALKGKEAESETEKIERELTMAPIKEGLSEAQKRDQKTGDNTPTGAEAIKRQSELQMQLANLNKTDMNSQITADALKRAGFDVDPGKVTPEMVEQVKGAVRKELSFLNQYVPDEYRHKEGISLAEAKALKEKGFTPERMSRDFFVTDAPGGMDPLAMAAKRPKPPAGMPPAGAPAPGAVAPGAIAPSGRPAAPPPMAMPGPMAAPAAAPVPVAGPLSLSGGAVDSSQAGPLRLDTRSLQ